MLSYLIGSYLILSYLMLSCLILSYLILSYLILSYRWGKPKGTLSQVKGAELSRNADLSKVRIYQSAGLAKCGPPSPIKAGALAIGDQIYQVASHQAP